jgi:CRISPR-associated protein Csm2
MESKNVGPGHGQRALPPVKYFDPDGSLREALVDSEAEIVANLLGEEGLSPTQIRAYFSEVLTIRRRIELELAGHSDPEKGAEAVFLRHRPTLKMLRAKVHYAHTRGTIKGTTKKFLEEHVKAVQTLKEFRAFCAHFEAVVGFHKGKRAN